ncbi:MAG: M48 family metalloprotease [Myxococcales bacterium]|nr:M48 family metalloprotease [Myxococcales bacterium]
MNGLRAKGDADLAAMIMKNPAVRRAIKRIEDKAPEGTRRALLSTAVRLTEAMAPELYAVMQRCREKLEISSPLETFVYPAPMFNAAAVRPEGGRFFVMFSSALLDAFAENELAFVVGHELAHHLFEHHAIPVQALLNEKPPFDAGTVLSLFAWQRYAEISCDRAGLVCAGDIGSARRALFRVASGLRGAKVTIDVEQFVAQLGDLTEEVRRTTKADDDSPRFDWFSTHPFSPVRLRAVELCARSTVVGGAMPLAELEAEVEELMGLMSPSYLKDRTESAEAMRRLLFAGGVLLADLSQGEKRRKALEALESFLGAGSVPLSLDTTAVREDLPRRIAGVKDSVPPLRRGQVVRDLLVIAQSDGVLSEAEEKLLREIADAVAVDFEEVACSCVQEGEGEGEAKGEEKGEAKGKAKRKAKAKAKSKSKSKSKSKVKSKSKAKSKSKVKSKSKSKAKSKLKAKAKKRSKKVAKRKKKKTR